MPHQEFLLQLLSDEVSRREANSLAIRTQRAHLEPDLRLELWDPQTEVTYDQALFNELASLRFLQGPTQHNVTIAGPVGVGKTFKAHALGHLACRAGHSVFATRTDRMLKSLRHARLDGTHPEEIERLLRVELLILDDFGMDALSAEDGRDVYEILTERNRSRSTILTSNRGPDEWLALFAEPVRGQAAIDRFANNSYDLVMDGPSYRKNLKPKFEGTEPKARRKRQGHA